VFCCASRDLTVRGRQYGGVMTTINQKFKDHTETISCASERYVIVAVGDLVVTCN